MCEYVCVCVCVCARVRESGGGEGTGYKDHCELSIRLSVENLHPIDICVAYMYVVQMEQCFTL